MTNLETYLAQFSEADWTTAVDSLLPCIHPVDQTAVQIWFRFYPLTLRRYIDAAENKEETLQGIVMQGDFDLAGQIDSSHHFLYGHRYWKTVKAAIEAEAVVFKNETPTLEDEVKQIGMLVAEKLKVERPLLNAIVIIGLMTLNQVGIEAFKAAAGEVEKPTGAMAKSPDKIVAEREQDDSQGIFGFLKTVNKRYSINFADLSLTGSFPVTNDEDIATASGRDRSSDWKSRDERCWEGVVPVECRAASCGTCWVGVLGGKDKLSEVNRIERRAMKVFGYNQPDEPKPFLRLACKAKATGNATIVIPPWNAVFGKKVLGNVEELELVPATTSAKALRETIATAASGE